MQKYCIADTTFLFRGLCVIDNTNGVTGWYLPAVKEVPLCGLTSRNWEFSTSYVIPRYDAVSSITPRYARTDCLSFHTTDVVSRNIRAGRSTKRNILGKEIYRLPLFNIF